MNIEHLPSGSYRLRQTKNGITYKFTVDKKPGKREAQEMMDEYIRNKVLTPDKMSFEICANEYIKLKNNVLSPSTIRSYHTIIRTLSADFKTLNIHKISQIDIQKEINNLCEEHKPKTVRNIHGFISAVIHLYRPDMLINTTLPQKVKFEPYTPTVDEVRRVLDASIGTKYHVPFMLGVLGLRRSEVCALTKEDIKGNELEINKAMIANENNQFVIVERTKSTEGKRTIYITDELKNEIDNCDKICDMPPGTILEGLHAYQKQLKIPEFRFHDLRHFYATYAHEQGMSDADIMASGGWKSDYTMKSVYRHATEKSKKEKQMAIAKSLFS